MKYILTLFLLVSVAFSLQAQFSYGSIQLEPTKKIMHVSRVPFNKITVFDNRFDTTNFLVNNAGLPTPEIDGFSMAASLEIERYIEKIIAPLPKDNRQVYINLKQLRFGNLISLSRKLFFSAEAYSPVDGNLIKIFSFAKIYSFRHSYGATITRALNEFIKRCCMGYALDTTNQKNYAIEDLKINVRSEWAELPIIRQNTRQDNYVDGIYRTWSCFRDDRMSFGPAFTMWMAADSTYRISLSAGSSDYKNGGGNVHNIFAVNYDGKLYIPVLGKYFIPLEKNNNTFYFYIPHSLHDMTGILPKWNYFEFAATAGASQIDLNGFNGGGGGGGKGGSRGGGTRGGGGSGGSDWSPPYCSWRCSCRCDNGCGRKGDRENQSAEKRSDDGSS